MRALPLISLCVAAQALGSAGQAVSIGNDGWGLDLTLSTPPRQCQALRLWYNVGPVSGAPDSIRYPDSAVVQFLTPDSSETQWMVRFTADRAVRAPEQRFCRSGGPSMAPGS